MTTSGMLGERHLLVTGAALSETSRAACAPHFTTITELIRPTSPAAILAAGRQATDYVLGGPEFLGAAMLDGLPHLRRLVLLGTGIPSFVDLKAMQERGIDLRNTPHLNAESVAEFAIGALIMTAARVFASAQGVRSGAAWHQGPWRTLAESRIGLVGLGHIGEALARRLRALGARDLRYTSRTRKGSLEGELGLGWQSLGGLVRDCHAICFHVPYDTATHAMIDDALLDQGHSALALLCFSNPRIVDPTAVRQALLDGRLGHLYLDGYYREWIDNRGVQADAEGLLRLPPDRFSVTSHIAAQTYAAITLQLDRAIRSLIEG